MTVRQRNQRGVPWGKLVISYMDQGQKPIYASANLHGVTAGKSGVGGQMWHLMDL